MDRPAPPVREAADWLAASAHRPCPSCGATAGGQILRSGEFARCVSRPSERPLVTGGWLHARVAPS